MSFLNVLGHQADDSYFETAPDGKGAIWRRSRPLAVEWAEQEREQLLVNRAFEVMDRNFVDRLVRRLAHERHAMHAQYDGFWSGGEWKLVRITQRVAGKGGVRFEAGDITIGRFDHSYPFGGERVFYSLRGSVNCSGSLINYEEV